MSKRRVRFEVNTVLMKRYTRFFVHIRMRDVPLYMVAEATGKAMKEVQQRITELGHKRFIREIEL